MNTTIVSAECNAGMCGACTYEDCACECHDACDNTCPHCGEEGIAEGAYCHMVDHD